MKQLKVDAIKDGTVIDHIPAGTAFHILECLNLREEDPVTVGTQLLSKKYGRKDIIKIENREFSIDELQIITLLAPSASFVTIRNYEAINKEIARIPDEIRGVISCPNPACICNSEVMVSRFVVESRDPIEMRCGYCEHLYKLDDITRFLLSMRAKK